MRYVFPVLLLACVSACHSKSDEHAAPSGRTLVESRAPQWGGTNAWHVEPEPELSIGEADGDSAEYALDGVVGAARLSDGRIVVANFQALDLRYYDALGRHVRTVGRKGNGPGEFRLLPGIGRIGDTILVWDAFANRISRFDPTGAFGGSVSVRNSEMTYLRLTGFLADGSLLVNPLKLGDTARLREEEYVNSVTYLRFSATTGRQTHVLGPYFSSEAFRAMLGSNYVSEPVIFGRRGLMAIAGTGFYRAETNRFQATFYSPEGNPVRTLRRPYEAVRATAEDVAATRRLLGEDDDLTRMDPDLGAVQRRLAEKIPHRPMLPAVSQIRVDRQDNLWMQAYAAPDAKSAEWSVFDPEGHWLVVVEIPAHLEVLEIGDDYLLAKTVDPTDDVERVVLHRLRKPG